MLPTVVSWLVRSVLVFMFRVAAWLGRACARLFSVSDRGSGQNKTDKTFTRLTRLWNDAERRKEVMCRPRRQ